MNDVLYWVLSGGAALTTVAFSFKFLIQDREVALYLITAGYFLNVISCAGNLIVAIAGELDRSGFAAFFLSKFIRPVTFVTDIPGLLLMTIGLTMLLMRNRDKSQSPSNFPRQVP